MSSVVGRLLRTRSVVRAPIGMYRRGLGFLFGHRLLMLEHRGRTSGLPRYVVLEVADRPGPDRYVVPSGFGETAQWYRNVRADPRVRVSIGTRRAVPASARLMSIEECEATLAGYQHRHPLAWRMLKPTLEKALGNADGLLVPMVELTLH